MVHFIALVDIVDFKFSRLLLGTTRRSSNLNLNKSNLYYIDTYKKHTRSFRNGCEIFAEQMYKTNALT